MQASYVNNQELRVAIIRKEKIVDFVWQLIRRYGYDLLDIPKTQSDVAFGLRWDRSDGEMQVYALPVDRLVDTGFNAINSFLANQVKRQLDGNDSDSLDFATRCSFSIDEIQKDTADLSLVEGSCQEQKERIVTRVGGSIRIQP